MRLRTKVVCTLGPASSSAEAIQAVLRAGMNVARLNMAYSTLEGHARTIAEVNRQGEKLGLPIGVLLDLPGLKRLKGDMREVFGDHLRFAQSHSATFVALSFISSARQVQEVKTILDELRAEIPIIAKIELAEALTESEGIVDACDGIMVARGDLGLHINIEKVPLAQKRLIHLANRRGKPVITATQMLESMVSSPAPTRAEATDVANAVLDGTDALMLSEETAVGNYPVEATGMMVRIAAEAETAFPYYDMLDHGERDFLPEVSDATARAACHMAYHVGAKGIVAFTTGGTTALRVSKYRPRHPIMAVTPSPSVVKRLSLVWGVVAVKRGEIHALEDLLHQAAAVAVDCGVAGRGDLIVVTAGLPLAVPGSTNLVKVHAIP